MRKVSWIGLLGLVAVGCTGSGDDTADTADSADTASTGTPELTCEEDMALLSAGKSFGECWGPCLWELAVSGMALHLVVSNWDETTEADTTATLTADGEADLCSAVTSLVGTTLDEIYGCPDCADGGASFATLSREGTESEHTWEYQQAPWDLVPLDALINEMLDAMGTCTDTSRVTIDAGCTAVY